MHTLLKGNTKEVVIGSDRPFVMIGEKINPTGNKKLAAAFQAGDLEMVKHLAARQVTWGADVLDVNVGVPGLDEIRMIGAVVRAVADAVDIPLCIDSGKQEILAAGLAACPGKPLVNSVNAEEAQLSAILPIVKDRGAAVIGLTITDAGIPKSPEERLAAAGKIIERAAKLGIPGEDVIIDPLVMTVGSDSKAALITLQTIELIRRELGSNINLGASNVSFGLPDRPVLNAAFLSMLMARGLAAAITNPLEPAAKTAILASDLFMGHDSHAGRWLKDFRQREKAKQEGGSTRS